MMKMSKKFLVVFLTFFIIILSGFASATTQEVIAADELIESSGFELEDFEIKQLAFFIDENVDESVRTIVNTFECEEQNDTCVTVKGVNI